jgi:hypothetical protein
VRQREWLNEVRFTRFRMFGMLTEATRRKTDGFFYPPAFAMCIRRQTQRNPHPLN